MTAAYVVADGARSTVRNALGIRMRGSKDLLGGVTALVRAPLWSVVGEYRYGIYVTTEPGAEGVSLPGGPGDRWGFGFQPGSGLDAAAAVPPEWELVDRVRRAAGIPDLPVRIERTGSFASAAQMADRFRAGRAFLVGDAAHRVTPRGGTGMNTAIHGGHDLGWKLAWVMRGWAGAELLDSYELEHRPVAAHNVARSADELGTRRPPGEELRVDLGARIDHHAALAGDHSLARALGHDVVAGWATFREALETTRDTLAADRAAAAWGPRFFVTDAPRELVGWGGFKGPPRDGVVELGYEIAAARQGHGLATAAARAMVAEAFASHRVTMVIAHTRAERDASNRVLEKVGFRYDAETELQRQVVWRWSLARPARDERGRGRDSVVP